MKRKRLAAVCAVHIVSSLVLFCGPSLSGETAEPRYFTSERLFKYLVELPDGYDSTATYDLIIALHGLGQNAEEFMEIIDGAEIHGMIIVTLQAPYAIFEDDEPGYDWNLYQSEDWELMFRAGEITTEIISDFRAAIEREHGIENIYLLGFSQGAAQALYTYISRPEIADGVICFGGRFDAAWYQEPQIGSMKGLRVFLAHGDGDPRVPVEDSRAAYSFLGGAGAEVELEIFGGVHEVPAEILRRAIRWIDGNSGGSAEGDPADRLK